MNHANKIQSVVQTFVALLVNRQYSDAELLTQGIRLSAVDIAKVIAEYGRTLVMPPEDAWDLLEVTEIRNSIPRKWFVVMPLWTQEEGRSDLSVEVTVIEGGDAYVLELEDIHVL